MKDIRLHIGLWGVMVLLHLSTSAQEAVSPHPVLAEKIRIGDVRAWHQAAMRYRDSSLSSGELVSREDDMMGERRIGVTQKPEAEITAAINPVDSTHIVVCAMRIDPFAAVEPLSFTVYFSQDFGETWAESSFNGQIPGIAQNIGGGDPVVQID
ncbi:MAG: hypothetical protein AAFV07_16700, partial [Bacteroidota bacterium]